MNDFSDYSLFCSNNSIENKEKILNLYNENYLLIDPNSFPFDFLLPEKIEKYNTNLDQVINNFNYFIEKNDLLKNFYLNINKDNEFIKHSFLTDYTLLNLIFHHSDIETLEKFLKNTNINIFKTTAFSLSIYNSLDNAYNFQPKKEDFYSLKNTILETYDFSETVLNLCYNHYKEHKNIQSDSLGMLFLFEPSSKVSEKYTVELHKKTVNLPLKEKEIFNFYIHMIIKKQQDKQSFDFLIKIIDSIPKDKKVHFDIIKTILNTPSYNNIFKEISHYIDVKQEKDSIYSELNINKEKQNVIKKRI